ncbi:hypothetical protein V1264_024301 [Littorina saxatilis]|uniref:Uncharacterized protein n=1 Tax=Littorina saxatilis TaxID=31220 RepID=A0AAN9AM01_9CAEN
MDQMKVIYAVIGIAYLVLVLPKMSGGWVKDSEVLNTDLRPKRLMSFLRRNTRAMGSILIGRQKTPIWGRRHAWSCSVA